MCHLGCGKEHTEWFFLVQVRLCVIATIRPKYTFLLSTLDVNPALARAHLIETARLNHVEPCTYLPEGRAERLYPIWSHAA